MLGVPALAVEIEGISFCLLLRLDLSLLHAWPMEAKHLDQSHSISWGAFQHNGNVFWISLSCINSAYGSPDLTDPSWGVHWIMTSSSKKHSYARIKARVVSLPSLPSRSWLFLTILATGYNLLLFITEDVSWVADAAWVIIGRELLLYAGWAATTGACCWDAL